MTHRPTLALIASVARNGAIGRGNELIWRESADLQYFRATTLGHPIVMGRRTWDSLPARFRPLPGRVNIVVTRQADWQAEGTLRAGSIAEAAALCPADTDAWVIGGAEIYAQALPLAQTAVVTEIGVAFDGDAFAPSFGPEWTETSREAHTSSTGLPFSFVRLQHGA